MTHQLGAHIFAPVSAESIEEWHRKFSQNNFRMELRRKTQDKEALAEIQRAIIDEQEADLLVVEEIVNDY